jgi:putative FmdB family regulatory protein
MPIFEYRCQDCGARFEKLVRASDTDGPACPSCGDVHVSKELSTFSAHAGGKRENGAPMGGGCPAGMCRMPDVCGRN